MLCFLSEHHRTLHLRNGFYSRKIPHLQRANTQYYLQLRRKRTPHPHIEPNHHECNNSKRNSTHQRWHIRRSTRGNYKKHNTEKQRCRSPKAKLGRTTRVEHRIELEPGPPIRLPPYQLALHQRAIAKEQIEAMLLANVIRPARVLSFLQHTSRSAKEILRGNMLLRGLSATQQANY